MIEIDTFGLKKEFANIGGDERTVKVFSAGLGQEAVDTNSFLNRICTEASTTFHGVKFRDMRSDKFLFRGQKPKIEGELLLETFEEFWPLH